MSDSHVVATGIGSRQLRTALGRFATGVTVVTTRGPRGMVGMTVNSLCAVSLDPPLVLFCVAHRSQLCEVLSTATAYAINVLNEARQALSKQFARTGSDRFGAALWRPGTTGSPVLLGALAVFECVAQRVIEMGDHDIVVGRVVTLHPLDGDEPLVFFGGGYRRLAPAPTTPLPGGP